MKNQRKTAAVKMFMYYSEKLCVRGKLKNPQFLLAEPMLNFISEKEARIKEDRSQIII